MFEIKHKFGGVIILNEKEKRILELLERDPFLPQKDIAEDIGLSRSATANLITQLIEKGYIRGKAYILEPHPQEVLICIGAANVDTKHQTIEKAILQTSNPSTTAISMGGVIRNISENIGRLDINASLLSIVGHDAHGQMILDHSQGIYSTHKVDKVNGYNTGSYSAIVDKDGDLIIGLADMAICDLMNEQWLVKHELYLRQSKMIVIDTNVDSSAIQYLQRISLSHSLNSVIVGVSSPKMNRVPKHLNGFQLGIFNLDESQTYFKSKQGSQELAKRWLKTGLKQVIITNGSKPTVYGDATGITTYPILANPHVVNVTGAGDSFIAGVLYGLFTNKNIEDSLYYGLANSYHTVSSPLSVRNDLNLTQLENEKEIYKNESISRI